MILYLMFCYNSFRYHIIVTEAIKPILATYNSKVLHRRSFEMVYLFYKHTFFILNSFFKLTRIC